MTITEEVDRQKDQECYKNTIYTYIHFTVFWMRCLHNIGNAYLLPNIIYIHKIETQSAFYISKVRIQKYCFVLNTISSLYNNNHVKLIYYKIYRNMKLFKRQVHGHISIGIATLYIPLKAFFRSYN